MWLDSAKIVMIRRPNQSLEPTAVGACSLQPNGFESAVAQLSTLGGIERIVTLKYFIFILLGALLTSGCKDDSVKVTRSQQLHDLVGRRVVLAGIARQNWVGGLAGGHGAMIDGGDDLHVWIDGRKLWPTSFVDHEVRVEGILMQQHFAGLTNFYLQEPVLPGMSGIGGSGVQKGFDYYVVHIPD